MPAVFFLLCLALVAELLALGEQRLFQLLDLLKILGGANGSL